MTFYKEATFYYGKTQGSVILSHSHERDIKAKGRGGGGSTHVTTQTSEPWTGQKIYLTDLFQQAQQQYQQGRPYPGQMFAPASPQTEAALKLGEERAMSGSPLMRGAQSYLQGVLSPDFISNNPAYQAALSANVAEILPQIQSQFGGRGALRSGLAREAEQAAASREAAKLALPLMQIQERAASVAPMLASQDYSDIAKLAAIGEEREALEQQRINEEMARHQYPEAALARYASLIQGNYGGTSTSEQPIYRGSRLGGALGAGLGGAGVGATVGGPWGAAIGGGLGLLSGLL